MKKIRPYAAFVLALLVPAVLGLLLTAAYQSLIPLKVSRDIAPRLPFVTPAPPETLRSGGPGQASANNPEEEQGSASFINMSAPKNDSLLAVSPNHKEDRSSVYLGPGES